MISRTNFERALSFASTTAGRVAAAKNLVTWGVHEVRDRMIRLADPRAALVNVLATHPAILPSFLTVLATVGATKGLTALALVADPGGADSTSPALVDQFSASVTQSSYTFQDGLKLVITYRNELEFGSDGAKNNHDILAMQLFSDTGAIMVALEVPYRWPGLSYSRPKEIDQRISGRLQIILRDWDTIDRSQVKLLFGRAAPTRTDYAGRFGVERMWIEWLLAQRADPPPN